MSLGAQWYFVTMHHWYKKFTDISHLKANSLPTPPAESASEAAGLRRSEQKQPLLTTTGMDFEGQGSKDECQYIKDCHILRDSLSGADHINLSASDQRQRESPLFCWWCHNTYEATDSIHCQLYIQRSTCQGAEVGRRNMEDERKLCLTWS